MVRRLVTLIGLAALLAVPFASSSVASAHNVETVPGNPVCSETKIEPVASGTYALDGGGHVVITVTNTSNGPTFSFDTEGTALVGAVIVKGGPNANVYTYSPPVESDTGLHAPVNPNNGKYYGLSHICFESEKKDGGDPGGKK